MDKGPKLLGLAIGVVLSLYPFCVYFGLQQFGPRIVAAVLLTLFCVRYLALKSHTGFLRSNLLPAASATGVVFCAVTILADQSQFLKFYPVFSNIFFLILFASSLRTPPTVIERVARLRHPNLSPRGVRHTRQVAVVWCFFFVLNGMAALYTAMVSTMKVWTLYNGFIAYLLMGVLFGLEFLVRKARMAQDRREGWSA